VRFYPPCCQASSRSQVVHNNKVMYINTPCLPTSPTPLPSWIFVIVRMVSYVTTCPKSPEPGLCSVFVSVDAVSTPELREIGKSDLRSKISHTIFWTSSTSFAMRMSTITLPVCDTVTLTCFFFLSAVATSSITWLLKACVSPIPSSPRRERV
jgi:hypothetical protein